LLLQNAKVGRKFPSIHSQKSDGGRGGSIKPPEYEVSGWKNEQLNSEAKNGGRVPFLRSKKTKRANLMGKLTARTLEARKNRGIPRKKGSNVKANLLLS